MRQAFVLIETDESYLFLLKLNATTLLTFVQIFVSFEEYKDYNMTSLYVPCIQLYGIYYLDTYHRI